MAYPPSYPPPPPQGYYPPPPPPGYPVQPYGQSTNTLAIISLIAGIIGLIMTCCGSFFGAMGMCCVSPLPIAAVIMGHLAMGQINRNGEGGKGLATAGLILGYICIVLLAVLIILVLVLGVSLGTVGAFSEIMRDLQ